jgi:glycosyltransferase involved in cell wall biosynthesis
MEKSGMKVLMIAPLSIGIVHGGVRMQSLKTAEHLKKLGVEVDLFNPWQETDPEAYDLVHLFLAANETLTIANSLENMNCRMVVSPVFFTRRSAAVIRQSMQVVSIAGKFVRGIFSDYSIKASVCKAADMVLPNTTSEAGLIRDGFGIPDKQITVIPNGVDSRFADASPGLFRSEYDVQNFTLFVGDASAKRKNVLSLLQQHTPSDQPLVIIGRFDGSDYSVQCLDIVNSRENVFYLGPLGHDDPMLASAYAAADVFTLPSQFETPGIAALEAALAGCRIAITKVGGTQEVFGNHSEYIDPEDSRSIIQAIRSAHAKPKDDSQKNIILKNYTWEIVAQKTLDAYKTLTRQITSTTQN